MVNFLQRQILDDPTEQTRKMQDFTMRAAHSRKAMDISEEVCELRIDISLIVTLMLDHLALNKMLFASVSSAGTFSKDASSRASAMALNRSKLRRRAR